jgi:hypothetical protein
MSLKLEEGDFLQVLLDFARWPYLLATMAWALGKLIMIVGTYRSWMLTL